MSPGFFDPAFPWSGAVFAGKHTGPSPQGLGNRLAIGIPLEEALISDLINGLLG